MISLKSTIRDKKEDLAELRKQGVLPAVLYGDGIKSTSIAVALKDFQEIFTQAGESSLISLESDGKKYEVLIHQADRDPVGGKFIHVDFYHPSAKKKVEAEISLVFSGESSAVKDLGGVLVKEIHVLNVKGLAHKLPREIIVDISSLKNYDDRIRVGDLMLPETVEATRGKDEIVALAVPVKEEKEEVKAAAPVAAPVEGAKESSESKPKSKE